MKYPTDILKLSTIYILTVGGRGPEIETVKGSYILA